MAGEKYKLAQLSLPGGIITQFENDDLMSYEFEEFLQRQGGQASPSFVGTNLSMHKMTPETQQIKTVLDICATDSENEGIVAGFDSGDANQTLTFRKSKSRGVRTPIATGAHISQFVTDSMFAWESIAAPEKGNATISTRLMLLSALTNDVADTLSATTIKTESYKVGPVIYRITGDSADRTPCVQSWNWDNQIEYDDKACSGSNIVDYSAVDNYEPIITVDTEDIPQAIALEGTPAIVSFNAYLRKNGVADNVAEHIRFSVTAGQALPAGSRQLRFRVQSFAINTAVAIS